MCEVTQKTCSRCKEEKTLDLFYKNKSRKDGVSTYCKFCMNEAKKKTPSYERSKKNFTSLRTWAKENKGKVLESKKRYYKKISEKTDEQYIKSILCNGTALKYNEIPQSIIECKRIEMQIKRQIKEMTK